MNLRTMSRTAFVVVVAFAATIVGPGSPAQTYYWFESYERAISMIDAGSLSEASTLLDSVIESHPMPVVGLRVPGDRFIDYLPYFERARINVAQGNFPAASRNLDICEAFGVSEQNTRVARKIATMRQTIATRQGAKASSAEPAAMTTSAAALH